MTSGGYELRGRDETRGKYDGAQVFFAPISSLAAAVAAAKDAVPPVLQPGKFVKFPSNCAVTY